VRALQHISVVNGRASAYDDFMITAIIQTRDNEVELAHALAALVPAATEGVVRQVIVIDHGSTDGTRVVADAAGCVLLDAADAGTDPLRRAVETARTDWLLLMPPSLRLAPAWQRDALAFMDAALVRGKARQRIATIRVGTVTSGLRGWLRAPFSRGQGWLIARSACLGPKLPRRPSSFSFAVSRSSGVRRGAA
jgi:glycosyltransferase involved in cell wall biosynthesis